MYDTTFTATEREDLTHAKMIITALAILTALRAAPDSQKPHAEREIFRQQRTV
jgi:hypothetical protein